MAFYFLVLVVSLAALTWSADRFVLGASVTARRLGVSTLVIGLTVVGFGTSAPEMLVSGIAAWQGNAGIAVGNALGSNIANIGLILGLTASLYPLRVRSRILRRELPTLLVVTGITLALLWNLELSPVESGVLLGVLLALTVWMALLGKERGEAPDAMGSGFEQQIPAEMSLGLGLFWLFAGLALLLASARALVWAAVAIASALGVSDLVIGLTIVALGTSLPELATCVASARKGEHDIAVGNVIGSNLFNLLAVLGVAGLIAPLRIEALTLTRDFAVMSALTVAFFLMAYGFRGEGRINRVEGIVLVSAYVIYQYSLFVM